MEQHALFNYNFGTELANYVLRSFYEGETFYEFWEKEHGQLFEKLIEPNKVTLIHDYITYVLESAGMIRAGVNFINHLKDPEELESSIDRYKRENDIPVNMKLDFEKLKQCRMCKKCNECLKWGGYKEEIIEYLENKQEEIIDPAFNILIYNKTFLRDFHEALATWIKKHHTQLINSNKFKRYFDLKTKKLTRCTYWPKWLRKGVFFRDKGRCVINREDLTGLISVLHGDYHMDHIVPLDLYGNNDPTNLQLLCPACNSTKGSTGSFTSRYEVPLWEASDPD